MKCRSHGECIAKQTAAATALRPPGPLGHSTSKAFHAPWPSCTSCWWPKEKLGLPFFHPLFLPCSFHRV